MTMATPKQPNPMEQPISEPQTEASAAVAPREILYVEHKENWREIHRVRRALEKDGFMVRIAFDGYDALEKIKERRPTLIICWVMLPRCDGFELLALIRRDPDFAHLPFLMLTVRESNSPILSGYEDPWTAYILRSMVTDVLLLDAVHRLLASPVDPKSPREIPKE